MFPRQRRLLALLRREVGSFVEVLVLVHGSLVVFLPFSYTAGAAPDEMEMRECPVRRPLRLRAENPKILHFQRCRGARSLLQVQSLHSRGLMDVQKLICCSN